MYLILLHSEWPKLYGVLAVLSAIGLILQMITNKHAICGDANINSLKLAVMHWYFVITPPTSFVNQGHFINKDKVNPLYNDIHYNSKIR